MAKKRRIEAPFRRRRRSSPMERTCCPGKNPSCSSLLITLLSALLVAVTPPRPASSFPLMNQRRRMRSQDNGFFSVRDRLGTLRSGRVGESTIICHASASPPSQQQAPQEATTPPPPPRRRGTKRTIASREQTDNRKRQSAGQSNSYRGGAYGASTARRPHNDRGKIRLMFREAKENERKGRWGESVELLQQILKIDPKDSHSHLALARLESRRELAVTTRQGGGGLRGVLATMTNSRSQHTEAGSSSKSSAATTAAMDTRIVSKPVGRAREAFKRGTIACPDSIHLWQAWALYEQSKGDHDRARELFERALELDDRNPYVCHGYGLMERKLGNVEAAEKLLLRALHAHPTAAVVTSLGELQIGKNKLDDARKLYMQTVLKLPSERERTEVYLAAAWLEEKFYGNPGRAMELIELALQQSPSSSRAHVALARLEGRLNRLNDKPGRNAARRRLAKTCDELHDNRGGRPEKDHPARVKPEDGRIFNAWAHIEVKSKRYREARRILQRGMQQFPQDTTLFQAAGKVEERVGNYTGARDLYVSSLVIQPSAPTLLALAMMEMKNESSFRPSAGPNMTLAKAFFEEALILDPRHGPVYNAYGNMEFRRGNIDDARRVYERGINAQSDDPASVFHGLAKMELSLGNVDVARDILQNGLRQVETQDRFMDSSGRERVVFLVHTLGMLELNSDHVVEAQKVFKNGVQTYGNCSQLLLGCALCDVRLGNDIKARVWFERAVRVDQHHVHAWQAWGVMESRAGNYRKARSLFEAGIKKNERHGALWHAYASMVDLRLGNLTTARTLYEAGVLKCPKHVPLYLGWASLELKEGNLQAARRLVSCALTHDKTDGSGWAIAAQIEEEEGKDDLAGLILRRGIECCPNDASLYRDLGVFLVAKKSNYKAARQVMEEGLEANPRYAPLYHSLAELEGRVGNIDGLAKLHKRAARIFSANALEAGSSSSQSLGDKIRREQTQHEVSQAIQAQLGGKIGAAPSPKRRTHDASSSSSTSSSTASAGIMEGEVVRYIFEDDGAMTTVTPTDTS